MTCPSDSVLSDFTSGRLPPGEARQVRDHVAGCRACLTAILKAGSGTPETKENRPAGLPVPESTFLLTGAPVSNQSPDPSPLSPSASAVAEPPPLGPGQHLGRYLIIAPIGAGGMGVVYLGHDPALDRRVAIKLLRADVFEGQDEEGRARLMREAHAMAKLSHPNVVAIHDVGTLGMQVFLAMDFVEGQNLSEWLAAGPRPWREILAVFIEAGRGLEAAHAAGIIHRDFKPENVLIDSQGRALVTDFGLARGLAATEGRPPATPSRHPDESVRSVGLLGPPLTQPGSVSGTPGYMAPEQALGLEAEARADQYSFCVSLEEALRGSRQDAASQDGGFHAPMPGWVRQIVARGQSMLPNDRFPSMGDLLAALENDPAVARRRQLTRIGVTLLTFVVVGLGGYLFERRTADVCYHPEQRLASIWNDQVREGVRKAVLAKGEPGLTSAWAYTEKAIDRAAAAWVSSYTDACQATRVRHSQSESALMLRVDCLERLRLQLRVAVDFLEHAEKLTAPTTVGLVRALPLPSAECSDARSLSMIESPPPELRDKLDALRVRLVEARTLRYAGKPNEALVELEQLARDAHQLDYRPLEAEVLVQLGNAQSSQQSMDSLTQAVETEKRAVDLAEGTHQDLLALRAATSLVYMLQGLHRPPPELDAWLQRASALLQRAGRSDLALLDYERALASSEGYQGHNPSDVAHGRRAVALAKQLYGLEDSLTISLLVNLGAALGSVGAYGEMVDSYRQAIELSRRQFGPQSANGRAYWLTLADALVHLNRLAEAREALTEAVAGVPPGAENYWGASMVPALGALLLAKQGRAAEALPLADRATEAADRLHPSTEPWTRLCAAEAYLLCGRPAQAIQQFERAAALEQRQLEPASSDWVTYLRVGGAAYLAAAQPKKGREILERALLLKAAHPYPGEIPEMRFHLAQALVATHGDKRRAAELALRAREELAKIPDQQGPFSEVDAWGSRTFPRQFSHARRPIPPKMAQSPPNR